MINKKVFLFILFIVLSSSIVLYTQKKNSLVGIALYRYDDDYTKYLKLYLERNAKNNFSVLMVDSYNSQATQNAQIDMFLKKKVNMLAINLVDKTQAQKIIDKVSINDLPLIFFNREPDLDAMKTYDKVWYIGGKSDEAGIAQGRLIAESWKNRLNWDKNEDGKIQCIIIKGDLNDRDTFNRTEYMKKYIASNNMKLDILAEVPAMWKRENAMTAVEGLFIKYGNKIEYIICNNDYMALGALDALKKYGFNNSSRMLNYIPIVGIDGILACLNEIKNYGIFATVLQNPSAQTQALCAVSKNIMSGKSPLDGTHFNFDNSKYISIPYILVTASNLEKAIGIYK
ncbi:galactose ABC transporter substrate-binding protein [uncultured Brachyspira sp.]|uniref:galactose ABC transporter substrate-binding protein n=1 Tax=uncultured Brachyspira sp. TaxID=221953 RepID=UPI00260AAB15|nr:galactose ABC transporter substrate-binding protein [uncultured Brachyspira sp.]